MLTTEGTAFHQVITQHLSMLAAVTSPDLNEDEACMATQERKGRMHRKTTLQRSTQSFTFTLGQKLRCFTPKHTLEKIIKDRSSFWKWESYVMQITNLWKASFVPGFHKHRLHLFYSFGKIMLLLEREGAGQKCQVNSHHKNRNTQMITTLPQQSLFLSCQTQQEMEAETWNPLRALKGFLAAGAAQTWWESSSAHVPVPFHSMKPLPLPFIIYLLTKNFS